MNEAVVVVGDTTRSGIEIDFGVVVKMADLFGNAVF